MPFDIIVNQNVLDMEYAVRGPIPLRALELKKQGRKIIPCNIGNPQALGQRPITYYRQILSLIEEPRQIERERLIKKIVQNQGSGQAPDIVSDYVLEVSETILKKMETGMGAYTDSKGPQFIREAIAQFIDERDGVAESNGRHSNPDHIFITNGASEGAKFIIEMLISNPKDGIMIPVPQYPLYSATIRRCGGTQVGYYPDEDNDWALNTDILEEAYNQAVKDGIAVKGIVVINPANPTGAILSRQDIDDVIVFAKKHKLAIIADEVYQENTYGVEFVSFAKAVGTDDVPLFSLHSASKGFYGECGHRGGYLEVRNAPVIKDSPLTFPEVIYKQASVSLCSNTVGQVLIYLLVNPPKPGTEPYEQFHQEKKQVLADLHLKAKLMKEAFKKMDGMECFGRIGAMYLFPRLNYLPAGTTDFDYCISLLNETGLSTVNGSGFGQRAGTHHLRVAFLPPKAMMEEVLPAWIDFHNKYVNR